MFSPGKKYLDSAKIPGKNSCRVSQVSIESFILRPPARPVSRGAAHCGVAARVRRTDGKNAPLKTKSDAKANADAKAAVILSLSQNAPAARKDFFHRDSGGTGTDSIHVMSPTTEMALCRDIFAKMSKERISRT